MRDDINAAPKDIPKRRERHYSYDEGVDESPGLIEDEPVEVEAEVPAEDRDSVEKAERSDTETPAFEE
jgi:hypothetical protein